MNLKNKNGRRVADAPLQKSPASLGKVRNPIYVQLVMLFRRRIESGEWLVGQQIPTLEQLAEEVGVARATVRHAVGFLESEGLIGRYRGRGTFVLGRPESEIWHEIPADWESLIGEVPDVSLEWLDFGPASQPPTPSHPGGKLAEAYQYMRRLARHNHVPYLIGTSYVERSIFRAAGRKRFEHPVPLSVINRIAGSRIGRAEQTVLVGTADLEVAHRLDIHLNAAIMIVTRSVFDKDEILLYESEGLFRGDFVRMRMRLR